MRLTRELKPPYEKVAGEDYVYTSETRLTPSFAKVEQKLGQLEDIQELCTKMTAQPLYEKFSKTNICKLDFIGWNTAYDFENNCIIIYKDKKATAYFINNYGKTWALTREELE